MTRVLCPQDHCVFWDGGSCGADEISLEPDQLSCVTMEDIKDLILNGEDLEEWAEEIDDDDDGWLDGWFVNDNDDEQLFVKDEDPINGIDDDGDGFFDEDPPADINNDGCAGVCGVDDDHDGTVDEGSSEDDDEDGVDNEDWYDPLVFYFDNGSLIERTPVPWDQSGDGSVTGRDYVTTVIAEHVQRFRVERVKQGFDPGLRVDILLVLHDPETGNEVSLRTQVVVGGAL